VRVALSFEDAIEIIDALANKGDREADLARNAYKLAGSVADFVKNQTETLPLSESAQS
jgi:hypothetical protein